MLLNNHVPYTHATSHYGFTTGYRTSAARQWRGGAGNSERVDARCKRMPRVPSGPTRPDPTHLLHSKNMAVADRTHQTVAGSSTRHTHDTTKPPGSGRPTQGSTVDLHWTFSAASSSHPPRCGARIPRPHLSSHTPPGGPADPVGLPSAYRRLAPSRVHGPRHVRPRSARPRDAR